MCPLIPDPQTLPTGVHSLSPVIKLNRRRIKVSGSILPAGQQQNLSLPTFFGFVLSGVF